MEAEPDRTWLKPVSYTHLDVYKRQHIAFLNYEIIPQCTKTSLLADYGHEKNSATPCRSYTKPITVTVGIGTSFSMEIVTAMMRLSSTLFNLYTDDLKERHYLGYRVIATRLNTIL